MIKKAFFACSMRGGHTEVSQEFLQQVIPALEEIGLELVSKHQTQQGIISQEDQIKTTSIHSRDYAWLKESQIIIAEISNPSLGVGGEISDAVNMGKPVLAIYQLPPEKISAYIRGKLEDYPLGTHAQYKSIDDLKTIVRKFISSLQE